MYTSIVCLFVGVGPEPPPGDMFAFLQQHCIACHSAERAKGGVNLSVFKSTADVQKNARLWRTVVGEVQERRMPPSTREQPKEILRDQFLKAATEFLDSLSKGA